MNLPACLRCSAAGSLLSDAAQVSLGVRRAQKLNAGQAASVSLPTRRRRHCAAALEDPPPDWPAWPDGMTPGAGHQLSAGERSPLILRRVHRRCEPAGAGAGLPRNFPRRNRDILPRRRQNCPPVAALEGFISNAARVPSGVALRTRRPGQVVIWPFWCFGANLAAILLASTARGIEAPQKRNSRDTEGYGYGYSVQISI